MGGSEREREQNIKNKKINVCEGDHHRSSHHSNGLIRFNVHLNHLKWNESLMKTVEPGVVA